MDAESRSEQRTVHPVHCPTDGNPIRCFQVRLGGSVPRTISWGPLVTRGKKGAYQPSRIESSSYGCIDFRRQIKTRVNSLADGQSGCISIHKKNGGGGAGKGGGGTLNQKMNQVCKELWELVIGNGITITVECLLGKLSTLADEVSRKKDSSERKLNPRIFQKLCYVRGRPEIDLFATRVTTQLQAYFSWRTDHLSQRTDAFQQSWKNLKTYAFPPFSLVGRVLKKNPERACKPSFFLH